MHMEIVDMLQGAFHDFGWVAAKVLGCAAAIALITIAIMCRTERGQGRTRTYKDAHIW